MTPHESRNEFIITLVQILVSALITLVCILCGFYLYLRHIEGGTYLIGIITGAPASFVAGYGMAKASDKKPQAPLNINATAQAGDKPDGSSASISTSPSDAPASPSADTPTSAPDAPLPAPPTSAVPYAFGRPAIVDQNGNKIPNT